jgi:DNA-binding IclR family transcriptional regulator
MGIDDELLGAVSLSGLRHRFNEKTIECYRDAVFDAARKIRSEIGDM